ncbi:MAG: rhodanese-like domain-containing protein [Deltaproteobacteria bacterium]|nr:rhodanese-like domain-containing protein [Deltaproteobacteria bacterium]
MSLLSIFNFFGNGEGRINADELRAMLDDKAECSLIDVRTPSEFKGGHIPGSVSIPLNEIERLSAVPYKGKVVLYCAAGVRSLKARNLLKSRGVADVVDLKGGINAWIKAGGRLTAR